MKGDLEFEWNRIKESINIKKHGVSFQEAQTSFYDDFGIIYEDTEHSDNEERFILLGKSQRMNVLVVVHCERNNGVIRIISARKATKSEKKHYRGIQ